MTDSIIIFCAKYLFLLSVVIFIYYAFTVPDKKAFLKFAVLCGILALVLSLIAATLYPNPRPFMVTGIPPLVAHAPGNGFPSDHALFTGTIAAIITVSNPLLGACTWAVAVAVGTGRVLAGVHHTIDIIASFVIAIASVLAVRYGTKRDAPSETHSTNSE